jgi:hypothetical protein
VPMRTKLICVHLKANRQLLQLPYVLHSMMHRGCTGSLRIYIPVHSMVHRVCMAADIIAVHTMVHRDV